MSAHRKGSKMMKIMTLGDANVGKSTILNQFVNREFVSHYKPTVGADFMSKQMEIDGSYITLQLWDTAGQERFRSLGPTFYRGAECCILCYDITNKTSYNNIEMWMNNFKEYVDVGNDGDFPFLLLGNKNDLPDRKVTTEQAKLFSQLHGDILYFEVSAKTGEGINMLFQNVAQQLSQLAASTSLTPRPKGGKLGLQIVDVEEEKPKDEGGCC